MQHAFKKVRQFAGIGSDKTGHVEKLISGLGGFIGILLILIFTRQVVSDSDATLIVASMGASAVLLFAVPHGPLSQPWALAGGHIISAGIGVTCYLLIPHLFVAAALAVGLAITAMYYLRCIHPPGGATALTAVMAGSSVHELGYLYLLTPVLINAIIIFSVAILFNYLFHWRRYPAAIMHYSKKVTIQDKVAEKAFGRDKPVQDLKKIKQNADVEHDETAKIYKLDSRFVNACMTTDQIKLGHYYSNGKYGVDWAVRQIVDESDTTRAERDQVIYKITAGTNRRSSGIQTREEFAQWAKYEVFLNENSWQRVSLTSVQHTANS